MMKDATKPLLRTGFSILTLLVIAGCGGGGGETSPPPTPPVVEPPAINHTVSIVTSPAAGTTFLNTPLEDQFQWRFTSTGNASENYTVRAEPADAIVFTNTSGTVSPGQTVSSPMSYRCAAVGTSSVRIFVRIVSSQTEASFSWSVECQADPDPELVLDVKIYQGVLVGVMQAKLQGSNWVVQQIEHTWVEGSAGGTVTGQHSVSINRGTVVEVDLLRNHAVEADISITFSPATISDQARRILLTSVQEEHPDYDDVAFVRRVVYHVEEMGELDSAHMDIEIEPTGQLPFLNNQNNRVQIDLSMLSSDDLPEIKFVIVPIRSERGIVDDLDGFIDSSLIALQDLLPVSEVSITIADELDLSSVEGLDSHLALREMRKYRVEQQFVDEYVYGFMRGGGYAGLAELGGWVGVVDGVVGSDRHVFAHEVGHNLSLRHPHEWPWAAYIDGSIGTEKGWRLSGLPQRISGGQRTRNVMANSGSTSYGPIQFIPQQYYGIAKNHRLELEQRLNPSNSAIASDDFELADGRSFVFVGDATHRNEWSTSYSSVVENEPFPQDADTKGHTLRLIHVNSGTELYRTSVQAHHLAHANATDTRTWSARIPAYRGSGLGIQIVDPNNRVVFQQDLDKLEL